MTSFYREAQCAGYGRQVFDLYQLKKTEKQSKAPLTSEIVFTKLDPTGGATVVRTSAKQEKEVVGAEVLGAARDVLKKAGDMEEASKERGSSVQPARR